MEPNKTIAEYAFTFPERESLQNWEAVQGYAKSHSLVITWNSERQMLCVSGPEVEPEKIIDELGGMIFLNDNSPGSMHWDIGWRTNIQMGKEQYPLLIEGESDDQLAVIERYKAQAEFHIAKHLGGWIQTIASNLYETYLEKFCVGTPCSPETLEQALRLTDLICFDPASNKYEVYFTAGELLSPHLVHLVEIPGVLFEIDLEK